MRPAINSVISAGAGALAVYLLLHWNAAQRPVPSVGTTAASFTDSQLAPGVTSTKDKAPDFIVDAKKPNTIIKTVVQVLPDDNVWRVTIGTESYTVKDLTLSGEDITFTDEKGTPVDLSGDVHIKHLR